MGCLLRARDIDNLHHIFFTGILPSFFTVFTGWATSFGRPARVRLTERISIASKWLVVVDWTSRRVAAFPLRF